MGQIDIKHGAGEIDKGLILLSSAVYPEAINFPVEGRSDQLVPVPFGRSALAVVGDDFEQMRPAVSIAQLRNLLLVDGGGNVADGFDSVEIRNQWNCQPVVSPDLVITADHNAILAI